MEADRRASEDCYPLEKPSPFILICWKPLEMYAKIHGLPSLLAPWHWRLLRWHSHAEYLVCTLQCDMGESRDWFKVQPSKQCEKERERERESEREREGERVTIAGGGSQSLISQK